MAGSLNKVTLIGHLGQEPDISYLRNGEPLTRISIATNESWKDKATGELREKVEWHRIVAFRRLAEVMGEYLRKGSKVYIEGKLSTSKYQDKETGKDCYSTEIIADTMIMLDSKRDNSAPQKPAQNQASGNQPPSDPFSYDDDIPF